MWWFLKEEESSYLYKKKTHIKILYHQHHIVDIIDICGIYRVHHTAMVGGTNKRAHAKEIN